MRLGYLKIATLIFCFTPAYAHAQTKIHQDVYEGSLGNTKITLQILKTNANNNNIIVGSYFYNKKRQNINLLKSDSEVNVYNELPPNCTEISEDCKVRAEFRLAISVIGLKGTWVSKTDNKSYAIDLRHINQNDYLVENNINDASYLFNLSNLYYDFGSNFENNPYLKKQYFGAVTYSDAKTINGYKFQTVTDKLTKISYVSIASPQKGHDLNNIKSTLSHRHIELVAEGLDCNNGLVETSDKNTYGYFNEYMSNVIHVTDNVLVIQEGGSTYCGGAHPNNSISHHVFDMKSGKELSNNDLFNIFIEKDYNNDKTPQFQKLYDKISTSNKYLAPDFEGFPPDIEVDCKILFDENYSINLHPSDIGIIFSLDDAPHALGPCMGDYYRVPYKEMLPFMTPLAKQLFAKELGGK